RTVLSNAQWERIAPELPGKIGDPGRNGDDNRLFVEGVLWVARTGAPWRDLPDQFGKWYTVYTRFWRGAKKGVWEQIFKHLSADLDFEYVLIDATLVRVHQHGTGAKGGLKIRPSANHRSDDEERGDRRCAWQSDPLRALAGPAARHHQLRRSHGRHLLF